MDPVKQMHVIVVGDRDYPFSGVAKVNVPELGALMAEAKAIVPDLAYEDLVKVVVRVGVAGVKRLSEAHVTADRGGMRFTADATKKKAQQDAAYAKILSEPLLAGIRVSRVEPKPDEPEGDKEPPVTT